MSTSPREEVEVGSLRGWVVLASASLVSVVAAWWALGVSLVNKHTITDPAYYSAFTVRFREIAAANASTFLHKRWGYIDPSRIAAWMFGESVGYVVLRLVTICALLLLFSAATQRTRVRDALPLWLALLLCPMLWRLALVYYAGAFSTLVFLMSVALMAIDRQRFAAGRDATDRVRFAAQIGIGAAAAVMVGAHTLVVLVLGPLALVWAVFIYRSERAALWAVLGRVVAAGVVVTAVARVSLRAELGSATSLSPFAEGGSLLSLRRALQTMSYPGLTWVQWSQQLLWVPVLWVVWWLLRRTRRDVALGTDPFDVIGLGAPIVALVFVLVEFVGQAPILEHFGYSGQFVGLGLGLMAAVFAELGLRPERVSLGPVSLGSDWATVAALAVAAVVSALLRFRVHVDTFPWLLLIVTAGLFLAEWLGLRGSDDRRRIAAVGVAMLVSAIPVTLSATTNPSSTRLWSLEGQYSTTFWDPDRSFADELSVSRSILESVPSARPDNRGWLSFVRPDGASRAAVVACRSTYPWNCMNDADTLMQENIADVARDDPAKAAELRKAMNDAGTVQGHAIHIHRAVAKNSLSAQWVVLVADSPRGLASLRSDAAELGLRAEPVATGSRRSGSIRLWFARFRGLPRPGTPSS